MKILLSRSCWCGILSVGLLPAVVLANPAEDLAQGEKAYINEDLPKAMELMGKAAKANYAPAQVRFGEVLDAAEFNKEAVEWYRKAAEQGNANGEFRLGYMYFVGEGVEKNNEKALYWTRRAAEKNHILAVKTLLDAYQNGLYGLPIDLNMVKILDERLNILIAAEKRAVAEKLAERAEKKAAKESTATTESDVKTPEQTIKEQ